MSQTGHTSANGIRQPGGAPVRVEGEHVAVLRELAAVDGSTGTAALKMLCEDGRRCLVHRDAPALVRLGVLHLATAAAARLVARPSEGSLGQRGSSAAIPT